MARLPAHDNPIDRMAICIGVRTIEHFSNAVYSAEVRRVSNYTVDQWHRTDGCPPKPYKVEYTMTDMVTPHHTRCSKKDAMDVIQHVSTLRNRIDYCKILIDRDNKKQYDVYRAEGGYHL